MNARFVRIVRSDGQSYPLCPAGVSAPSPIVGTPATPSQGAPLANLRAEGEAGFHPLEPVSPTPIGAPASRTLPVSPTEGEAGVNPLSSVSPLIMSDGHAYDPKRHGIDPCLECRRGSAGCICGMPEPQAECFVPGLNRDPDWYRIEL